jgi:hypothetical protein
MDFSRPDLAAESQLMPRTVRLGPAAAAAHDQLVELGAAQSLEGWSGMGASTFGSSRRMVLEQTKALKEGRRAKALEAGFTLDGVGSSAGDPALLLPRYLPYYDASQVLFLKSPER